MTGYDWTGAIAPWGEQGRLQHDEMGRPVVEIATDGACGRSWNDALGTSLTPAPSARCPFEYDHDDPDELGAVEVGRRALARAEATLRQAWEAGAPPAIIEALEYGREAVRGEYHNAWRAEAHEREHEAIRRAAHVDLTTPRAVQMRAFLAGRLGDDMVTDDVVRATLAGIDGDGEQESEAGQ